VVVRANVLDVNPFDRNEGVATGCAHEALRLGRSRHLRHIFSLVGVVLDMGAEFGSTWWYRYGSVVL